METIMSIKDLSFYYGDFKALKNINIDIIENEVLAFIGPSGCGKSTLLRILNRMSDLATAPKVEGSVTYRENEIFKMDTIELRKKVGMVFQKPNPFPMSIYDNITYGPRMQGIKNKTELDEIVEDSLKKAAIWNEVKDKLKKNAISLSGGQQQRICIARSIAMKPEILLMDEPTSALDPISTAKIEDLISELKSQYTIVIVTHNMQQAARISDRTAFFLLGKLIEVGETKNIFNMPRENKTEDYITGRFG